MSAPAGHQPQATSPVELHAINNTYGLIEARWTPAGPVVVRIRGPRKDVHAVEIACAGQDLWLRASARPPDHRLEPIELEVGLPTDPPATGSTSEVVLNLCHGARLRSSHMADAALQVTGHAWVDVDEVVGDRLDVGIRGPGRFLARGDVGLMHARVNGTGNVCFMGSADDADLEVHGAGFINVTEVRRSLARTGEGSGNVLVARPPHSEFEPAPL